MSITALDIQNEGFEHSLRGYDVEQVDVFLERVANEVDEMNKQIETLTEQLAEAKAKAEEAAAAPALATEDLENANTRADEAKAELDKANSKFADAIVLAEEAERRAKKAEERLAAAEAEIEPLREQLAEKNKLDSAISQAFISAQRSADALKEEARAEGDRIYRESEAKAREFIREALVQKAQIYQEIEALRNSSDQFRARYLALIESFQDEARDKFRDMETAAISDEEIDAMLPDIESMPGIDADGNDISVADEAPRLTTESIPVIGGLDDED